MNPMRKLPILAVAGLGLLAAACGGPAGSSGSTGSSSQDSGYGSAPAASPATAPAASPIKAALVTVAGKQQTVLTDSRGMTLYYFTPDRGGKVTCAGGCAQAWPPLKVAGGTPAPGAPDGLSGSVGTVQNPEGGTQLTFNRWPLYTYAGDTGPGQATGQGQGGKWFVVTSAVPQS